MVPSIPREPPSWKISTVPSAEPMNSSSNFSDRRSGSFSCATVPAPERCQR
ncbi:hypothetical protein KJK32_11520 [Streptomyces sp. JCM17656]|nr:hypothetical protein KJK32_11520 [Streptomyces sp. JCM17656]